MPRSIGSRGSQSVNPPAWLETSASVKVVALFREMARPYSNRYSLRVPEEETDIFKDGNVNPEWQAAPKLAARPLKLGDILAYREIRSRIVDLGNELVGLGRASTHVGPAYRNAKWSATFFEVNGMVAQSIETWLDNRQISLDSAEQSLEIFNLLAKKPVPSIEEFAKVGIIKEDLSGQFGMGIAKGVLDLTTYDDRVLAPAFEKVVADVLATTDQPFYQGTGIGITVEDMPSRLA